MQSVHFSTVLEAVQSPWFRVSIQELNIAYQTLHLSKSYGMDKICCELNWARLLDCMEVQFWKAKTSERNRCRTSSFDISPSSFFPSSFRQYSQRYPCRKTWSKHLRNNMTDTDVSTMSQKLKKAWQLNKCIVSWYYPIQELRNSS